jgi:hypothetical protein
VTDIVPLSTLDSRKYWRNRRDFWWGIPAFQFVGLVSFIIYAFWAIMIDTDDFKVEKTHYVSPFFSPEVEVSGWPDQLSPALILIWAPVGFRTTCYYARKVYFRAFLADPPGCAIGEFRKLDGKYKGESSWPWILNNLHRYFFYAAFILAAIKWYDFVLAMRFETETGATEWGLGIGTVLLGGEALFLTLYVLSCHSFKHLLGGGIDCHNCSRAGKARYAGWKRIKNLNENHHIYFWISLVLIVVADVYIRLIAKAQIEITRLF